MVVVLPQLLGRSARATPNVRANRARMRYRLIADVLGVCLSPVTEVNSFEI
jgi:hypothetical protein